MNYYKRIEYYNILNNKLKTRDDCINKKHIVEKTGGSGFIYKKTIKINKNNYIVSLKEQDITIKNKYKLIKEYEILKKCTNLVNNKITQNLPLIYDLYICDKNKFIFYNELATGDFFDWCYYKHTDEEWESFLFQLWVGYYAMKKHLKIVHNDLRYGNVLYHKINKNGENWKYKINKDEYIIPNEGYVFMIWDFGSAEYITNDYIKYKSESNIDLFFFHELYIRLQIFYISERYTTIEIETYFSTDDEKQYVEDKKKESERLFRKSGRYDEKYKMALIYYLIENDKLNKLDKNNENNENNTSKKIYLPSNKIMKILKELSENNFPYAEKKEIILDKKIKVNTKILPPNELIKKYFKKYLNTNNKYTLEFII
jgi:hypothetical protein